MLRVNSGETVDSIRIPDRLVDHSTSLGLQVPVFRYALERWQADDYHAVIIHQGTLTKSKNALKIIEEAASPLFDTELT